MDKIKNSGFFRVISLVLILAFVALDISWAYPPGENTQNNNLATWSNFQQSIFVKEAGSAIVIRSIADNLFGNPEEGGQRFPLRNLGGIVAADLSKISEKAPEIMRALENIDVSRVATAKWEGGKFIEEDLDKDKFVPDDAILLVPYRKDGMDRIIQIALKGSPNASALIGEEASFLLGERFVVRDVPKDWKGPAQAPAEVKVTSKFTVSEPVAVVEIPAATPVTEVTNAPQAPKRAFTIRAIITSFLVILAPSFLLAADLSTSQPGVGAIFNALNNFVSMNSIITATVSMGVIVGLFFLIKHMVSPVRQLKKALENLKTIGNFKNEISDSDISLPATVIHSVKDAKIAAGIIGSFVGYRAPVVHTEERKQRGNWDTGYYDETVVDDEGYYNPSKAIELMRDPKRLRQLIDREIEKQQRLIDEEIAKQQRLIDEEIAGRQRLINEDRAKRPGAFELKRSYPGLKKETLTALASQIARTEDVVAIKAVIERFVERENVTELVETGEYTSGGSGPSDSAYETLESQGYFRPEMEEKVVGERLNFSKLNNLVNNPGELRKLIDEELAKQTKAEPVHAFIASSGYNAAAITGAASLASFGAAVGQYISQGDFTGVTIAAVLAGAYFGWAAVRYFRMGKSALDALVKSGLTRKEARTIAIARNDGYRHPAYVENRFIMLHEGFDSHFAGMASILPIISRLFNDKYEETRRKADMYAKANSKNPDDIFMAATCKYPRIRTTAVNNAIRNGYNKVVSEVIREKMGRYTHKNGMLFTDAQEKHVMMPSIYEDVIARLTDFMMRIGTMEDVDRIIGDSIKVEYDPQPIIEAEEGHYEHVYRGGGLPPSGHDDNRGGAYPEEDLGEVYVKDRSAVYGVSRLTISVDFEKLSKLLVEESAEKSKSEVGLPTESALQVVDSEKLALRGPDSGKKVITSILITLLPSLLFAADSAIGQSGVRTLGAANPYFSILIITGTVLGIGWLVLRHLWREGIAQNIASHASAFGFRRFEVVDNPQNGSLIYIKKTGPGGQSLARVILCINKSVINQGKVFELGRKHSLLIAEAVSVRLNQLSVMAVNDESETESKFQTDGYANNDPQARNIFSSEVNKLIYPKIGSRGAAIDAWFMFIYPHPLYKKMMGSKDWLKNEAEDYLATDYMWMDAAEKQKVLAEIYRINEEFNGRYNSPDSGRVSRRPISSPGKFHDFKALDGFRAVEVTGVASITSFGAAVGQYISQGDFTGVTIAAVLAGAYFGWAAVRYFKMGKAASDALVKSGLTREEALTTAIARNDGYRHPAYVENRFITLHEGFDSHFAGMASILPIISWFGFLTHEESLKRAYRYAWAHSEDPERLFWAATSGLADIRKIALKNIGALNDLKKIARLLELSFNSDNEIKNMAIRSLLGMKTTDPYHLFLMATSGLADIREIALKNIGALNDLNKIARLLELSFNSDNEIKNMAIRSLLGMKTAEALDELRGVVARSINYTGLPIPQNLAILLADQINNESDLDKIITTLNSPADKDTVEDVVCKIVFDFNTPKALDSLRKLMGGSLIYKGKQIPQDMAIKLIGLLLNDPDRFNSSSEFVRWVFGLETLEVYNEEHLKLMGRENDQVRTIYPFRSSLGIKALSSIIQTNGNTATLEAIVINGRKHAELKKYSYEVTGYEERERRHTDWYELVNEPIYETHVEDIVTYDYSEIIKFAEDATELRKLIDEEQSKYTLPVDMQSSATEAEKVRQLFEIVESALNNNRARLVDAGNELMTFLAERDELPAEAGLLLVLGSDDLEVARGAAELYKSGKTKFKYVMCSGKGKGDIPEGQRFTDEMIANGVPKGAFLLPETNSGFMGQNLSFTAKQLAEAGKLSEINSVVVVQKLLYNRQAKAAIGKNFVTEEGKVATQAGYVYAPSVTKMDTEKTALELKEQMEQALAAADKLKEFSEKGFIDKVTLPPDVSSAAEKIREGINQLDADSIVTSLIVLARQAANSKDDNQKLIVGISTDWIPAYKDEHSFQYQATNSLVNKIKALPQALRSMGLNNVELVIEENSSTLASNVSKLALDSNARLSNVVVIASRESVEGGVFDGLRNENGGEKALLAGMDSEGLMELYKVNGEISDKVLDIDIMEILALTLEVATGKTPPRKLLAAPYDSAKRILILSPRATIKDYQKLRDINEGRKQALQAA